MLVAAPGADRSRQGAAKDSSMTAPEGSPRTSTPTSTPFDRASRNLRLADAPEHHGASSHPRSAH